MVTMELNMLETKYNSREAYFYCKDIKGQKEVRDKITDPYWAYLYCEEVKY